MISVASVGVHRRPAARGRCHRREAIVTAGAHVSKTAVFDKAVPQVRGGLRFVLDEKDLHARLDTNANGRIKAKDADVATRGTNFKFDSANLSLSRLDVDL
jgi:hypothetical protein